MKDFVHDDPNQNLYAHLVEVLNYLIVHYPEDALNKFEEVSYLYKHHDEIQVEEFLRLQDIKEYSRHCDQIANHSESLLA